MLVQVGLPGLALALYTAFAKPLAQLAQLIGRQPQRAALIFCDTNFSLIENFSESSLFADDALGNGFLLIALAQLHRFTLRSTGTQNYSGTDKMADAAQLREARQKRHRGTAEG